MTAAARPRVVALLLTAFACRPAAMSDAREVHAAAAAGDPVPQVRVALGWRAREVERRSAPGLQRFNDRDQGVIILEEGPVALAYADPAHAFVLPPGRYLRVDQVAGRVFSASASPQMDVLPPGAAVALGDSLVRLLEGAGWTRDTAEWRGPAAAVAEATRLIGSEGTGTTDVGRWHIPRSKAPWAQVPPDPMPYRGEREGVDVRLTVRPLKGRSAAAGVPQLLYTLRMEDDRLGGALFGMMSARRARHGGDMQTLTGWDAQPNERILPTTRR